MKYRIDDIINIDNTLDGILDNYEGNSYTAGWNYISLLGKCERYLVYKRTIGEQEIPPDNGAVFIMEYGRMLEDWVVDIINQWGRRKGIRVMERNVRVKDEDLKITGRLDGKITFNNFDYYPLEIKCVGKDVFETYSKILTKGKSSFMENYLETYIVQLQLYIHYTDSDKGYLLIVNRSNPIPDKGWLFIEMRKSDRIVEDILKKAERINKHVEEGTLPPRINNKKICDSCGFKHICNPVESQEIGHTYFSEHINPMELEIMVEDYLKIKEEVDKKSSTLEALKQRIKNMLEFSEDLKLYTPSYIIEGKWVEVKEKVIKKKSYKFLKFDIKEK